MRETRPRLMCFAIISVSLSAIVFACSNSAAGTLTEVVAPIVTVQGPESDDVGQTAGSTSADSLGPTWQVPWNPPAPMARRRAWERALLLPGRLVTLPLSGVWLATGRGLIVLEDQNRLPTEIPSARTKPRSRGVAVKPSRLGDRAGPGLGFEAFAPIASGKFESHVLGRYTGTLNQYNSTSLSITGNPAQLEYGYDWRPQEPFYGLGMPASRDGESDFASQTEFLRGRLRFGWRQAADDSLPRTAVAVWAGPRSAVTRTGREPGVPSFEQSFPALAVATLDRPVDHFVYGASVSNDTRSGVPHWSHGWRMRLQAERYDVPVRALALHSAADQGARFNRYQVETETGFSFWHDPRTFRFLVRVLDQNVDAGADRFLVSDLASLGGKPGLGGYGPGRFRDLDLVLGRATYLFPISRALEVDLHSEWGAVYHDVWADARPNTLKNSYGFALRGRFVLGAFASLGLDFSPEGARIRYALGGVQ